MDSSRLDRLVADAVRTREKRMQGYRERSLAMHPWVCGRCGREFKRENLHELTVHHKDPDHDNNPEDGSNWENLCLYCHDNEHQRFAHLVKGEAADFGLTNRTEPKPSTHQPPTNRAVSAVRSTTSSALVTNGATVAAAMIATVDSAPMFRSRHVPNTAYATSAAIAA